jgi:hypothetical protein
MPAPSSVCAVTFAALHRLTQFPLLSLVTVIQSEERLACNREGRHPSVVTRVAVSTCLTSTAFWQVDARNFRTRRLLGMWLARLVADISSAETGALFWLKVCFRAVVTGQIVPLHFMTECNKGISVSILQRETRQTHRVKDIFTGYEIRWFKDNPRFKGFKWCYPKMPGKRVNTSWRQEGWRDIICGGGKR